MKRLVLIAASVLLAACSGKKDTSAPWLTQPDLASHSAQFFPISQGTVHGPSATYPAATLCDKCHTDPASFKTYNCAGCHVMTGSGYHDDPVVLGSNHAASDFAALVTSVGLSTACRTCHPDGTGGPPAYHGQLFAIDAASKHAGLACGSCHAAVKSDVVNMKCASCHADPAQSPSFPTVHAPAAPFSGVRVLVELVPPPASCNPSAYVPTSADCLTCHARSHVDRASTHPQSDSSFGSSLNPNDSHRAAGCTTCHVVTTHVTAAVTPAPSGYDAVDFLGFVDTITSLPTSPSRLGAKGCFTCHGYGCGGNGL